MPSRFLNRCISRRTLDEVQPSDLPAFIKPVTPKQFRCAVYESSEAVAAECRGLPSDTAVFVSEPVAFRTEVRTFVLDSVVLDAAPNKGTLEASGAAEFVRTLAQCMPLPRTVVVDIGFIESRG